jgi:hypothetical protein
MVRHLPRKLLWLVRLSSSRILRVQNESAYILSVRCWPRAVVRKWQFLRFKLPLHPVSGPQDQRFFGVLEHPLSVRTFQANQ